MSLNDQVRFIVGSSPVRPQRGFPRQSGPAVPRPTRGGGTPFSDAPYGHAKNTPEHSFPNLISLFPFPLSSVVKVAPSVFHSRVCSAPPELATCCVALGVEAGSCRQWRGAAGTCPLPGGGSDRPMMSHSLRATRESKQLKGLSSRATRAAGRSTVWPWLRGAERLGAGSSRPNASRGCGVQPGMDLIRGTTNTPEKKAKKKPH